MLRRFVLEVLVDQPAQHHIADEEEFHASLRADGVPATGRPGRGASAGAHPRPAAAPSRFEAVAVKPG
jgi:hypothetical protein